MILNSRYNDKQSTIITTNYANQPSAGSGLSPEQRSAREPTLGDRIGDRMRSRLSEMCIPVEMTGDDVRQTTERAKFADARLIS